MVTSRNDAWNIAYKDIQSRAHYVPGGLSVMDEYTIEKPYGWIFFYDSTRFLQTRSLADAIAGNGPLVVLRDGTIHSLPTGQDLEPAVADFEGQHAELLRGLECTEP